MFAAAGGAVATTSVDLSRTYLDWAKRNLDLRFARLEPPSKLLQEDVVEWLANPVRERYDLIFLDPPTLSRSKRMAGEFDVQRDHVQLIHGGLARLSPGGLLIFSTNYRKSPSRLGRARIIRCSGRDLYDDPERLRVLRENPPVLRDSTRRLGRSSDDAPHRNIVTCWQEDNRRMSGGHGSPGAV